MCFVLCDIFFFIGLATFCLQRATKKNQSSTIKQKIMYRISWTRDFGPKHLTQEAQEQQGDPEGAGNKSTPDRIDSLVRITALPQHIIHKLDPRDETYSTAIDIARRYHRRHNNKYRFYKTHLRDCSLDNNWRCQEETSWKNRASPVVPTEVSRRASYRSWINADDTVRQI